MEVKTVYEQVSDEITNSVFTERKQAIIVIIDQFSMCDCVCQFRHILQIINKNKKGI